MCVCVCVCVWWVGGVEGKQERGEVGGYERLSLGVIMVGDAACDETDSTRASGVHEKLWRALASLVDRLCVCGCVSI